MLATGTGDVPPRRHAPDAPAARSPTCSTALNGLGADARSDLGTGCPPVTIEADGLDGGYAFVRGDVSSQFLSGLLMALPYARDATTVEVAGHARLAALRRR